MATPVLEAPLRDQLHRIVDRLARQYRPLKVILFGSRAWGETDVDSDVDLLLIKESLDPPRERRVRVSRLLYEGGSVPFPVDVLVYTPEEIEGRLSLGDPFVRKIIDEGIVLYDAARARVD